MYESNQQERLFYFRVYRVSRYLKKKFIFDNIYDEIDCALVLTVTKQVCEEGFNIHDIIIRLQKEVLKNLSLIASTNLF